MANDNLVKQAEEVEALSAIYGPDWTSENNITKSFSIKIKDKKREIFLEVTMPDGYPNLRPPKYEFSAPWMDRKAKQQLHNTLNETYLENVGEPIIYQWVEKIREVLQNMKTQGPKRRSNHVKAKVDIAMTKMKSPDITHGEIIADRKSTFQGHAAEVHSIEEVNFVLETLKENKKILNATHNMYAYRINTVTPKGTVAVLQDCNDDGEAHAGGRMLHLLQILNQQNTLVVVSRWYGGIHLGPYRFRHINNATRQAIEQAGLLKK